VRIPDRIEAPSLVQLAADSLRKMILSGDLRAGERLIEERLTEQFGISRPPLREALRWLQREGLVVSLPRRGAMVAPVTRQDAWEIATLRSGLERMALELALPVGNGAELEACRSSLAAMETAAKLEDRALFVEASFDFHLAVVALAGHRRLTEMYRSLVLQMKLCMALNVRAREQELGESLEGNVERHRDLLALIETGDRDAVLAGLVAHGERTFISEISDPVVGVQDAA
jgi:DNA-binding GntR family transcriptional regulator